MKYSYKDGGLMFPNMLPEVTAFGKDLRKLPKSKPKYDKSYLDWFLKQPINQGEISEIDSINANLRKPMMATGGQLTNSINNQFFPTTYNTPMLGFGDFLKDSGLLFADTMLSSFGGKNLIPDSAYSKKGFAKASNITSGISEIGGQIAANIVAPGVGGAVLGGVQQGVGSAVPDQDVIAQQKKDKVAMMEEQQKQMMLQQYNNGTMAKGGMLPSYAGGGGMQPNNITMYAEGGSHESNPLGGVPLGDKARVEAGEVRYNSKKYGDYIFSDRF